ncbi:MAG: zinc metallopeptidase [Cyclobacteriaceae bacterium]|nr:zinc metallopeptidase [Cyclobacteriaceae bacterium]
MRWRGRRQSANVEDRRRVGGKQIATGGGCLTIIVIALVLIFSDNPLQVLQQVQTQNPGIQTQAPSGPTNEAEDELAAFVKVVLADTEDVWNQQFTTMGGRYREPTLVLFSGSDRSACGFASAATGPFYCPADEKVFIDLSFYDQLRRKFKAPGDFAMAYVIAHEVGHHVQKQLGITEQVHRLRGRVSQEEYNEMSVRLELQADFFAGLWAHHAQRMQNILEEGDLEEAMRAANAIGDDRLQMESQGYVVPDAFTHGTSEQRMRWFRKGYQTGDFNQGDTFKTRNL